MSLVFGIKALWGKLQTTFWDDGTSYSTCYGLLDAIPCICCFSLANKTVRRLPIHAHVLLLLQCMYDPWVVLLDLFPCLHCLVMFVLTNFVLPSSWELDFQATGWKQIARKFCTNISYVGLVPQYRTSFVYQSRSGSLQHVARIQWTMHSISKRCARVL